MSALSSRVDYTKGSLEKSDLAESPTEQLGLWLQDATNAGRPDPNAMSLSTVGPDGKPTSRIVLLRGIAKDGLRFFTNYESRKAREVERNPNVCALFFWPELERQVRIEGCVTKLSTEESKDYFANRPRESQLGAWASPQSSVLADRDELSRAFEKVEETYRGMDVPLPPFWGGYLLVPSRFEFWQGRKNRLHDRLVYESEGAAYRIVRLAP